MSPRPIELNPEYFESLKGQDFAETVIRTQQLIETRVYHHNNEQKAVIDRVLPLTLDSAMLLRGSGLMSFTHQVITKGLVPYNPNNPKSPVFLHKAFGVDTSFNRSTNILTVTRTGKPGLSVRFTQHELPSPFRWEIMEAVAGLAVVPDDRYWNDIRNNGLVVGKLLGDFYDTSWRIESGRGILLPETDGTTHTPVLAPMEMGQVRSILETVAMKRHPHSPQADRLSSYRPVAILSDFRTHIPQPSR